MIGCNVAYPTAFAIFRFSSHPLTPTVLSMRWFGRGRLKIEFTEMAKVLLNDETHKHTALNKTLLDINRNKTHIGLFMAFNTNMLP